MIKPNNRSGGRPQSNQGKEKPLMTDEQAAAYRKRMIAAGVIVEGKPRGEYMDAEELAAYRQKLIDQGLLVPGGGVRSRIARPREFGTA
jgi:hypothetical protein